MDHIARDYYILQKYRELLLQECGGAQSLEHPQLIYKLQYVHQMMIYLRYLLSMEKQQLEKERHATQSLISLRQMYGKNPYYSTSSFPQDSKSHFALNRSNCVATPIYDFQHYSEPLYEKKGQLGLYRGHLEDVEKMCDEELQNMSTRIGHLRKIRRDWNDLDVSDVHRRNRNRSTISHSCTREE